MLARICTLFVLCTVVTGCATHCDEVAALRHALDTRTATTEPHIAIMVPFSLADPELTARVAKLEPVGLTPPMLGLSAAVNLRARPTSARFVVTDGDHLGVRLGVEIETADGATSWSSAAIDVRLRPHIDDGRVVLAVFAEDLRDVEPHFGADVRARLVEALAKVLPEPLRPADDVLVALADELVAYVAGEGFEVVRDELLPSMGELTRLRVELPDLPLSAAVVRATATPHEQLVIALRTNLPVWAGVDTTGAEDGEHMSVRMSGSTVTALANWAMDRGLIPNRYDTDFTPDDDGSVEPRLDWAAGSARPLRLHVFSDEPECLRVLVGAEWSTRVERGEIYSEVTNGEIVHVAGSWRMKLGVWLKQIGAGPMRFAQKHAASWTLSFADRERRVELVDATMRGDTLTLKLNPDR